MQGFALQWPPRNVITMGSQCAECAGFWCIRMYEFSHILPRSRCHDRPDIGDRWGKKAKTHIAQNIQVLHLYVVLNPIYAATSAAPVNVQATTQTRSTQSQLAGATSVVYIVLYLSLQTSQLATKCSGLLWSRFLWVRPVHLSHDWDRHRGILPVRRHIMRQVRLLNVCFLLFISYLTSCSSDSWHFHIFGVSDFNSDQPDHSSDRHLGSCAVVGVTANVESASRNIAKYFSRGAIMLKYFLPIAIFIRCAPGWSGPACDCKVYHFKTEILILILNNL